MKHFRVTPASTTENTIRTAEEALKKKYSQYNLQLQQLKLQANKQQKGNNSSRNSLQSESESFRKQTTSPNGILSPEVLSEKELPKISQQLEGKKFFQKKGRNEKKKKLSFRINDVNIKEDEDVQLNLKFHSESRKLASILLKEGAQYADTAPGALSRSDKFGNQIDHKQRRQKISFNEDFTVIEVENWKKYNNHMYDEDEEKCACIVFQIIFFAYLLSF